MSNRISIVRHQNDMVLRDGQTYRYYINTPGGKLYSNLEEYPECYTGTLNIHNIAIHPQHHGWYKTKEEAQETLSRYFKKMLTTATPTQIEDLAIKAIDKAMQKNELFTAYDITCRLRKENPPVLVIHNDIRDVVNRAYDKGVFELLGYSRDLRQLKPGVEAFVYGPTGTDFSKYVIEPETTKVVEIQATFGGVYSG